MSNNHTPSPWHIAWCKSGAYIYDQGTIAVVSDELIAWKANARLIAAAPSLLYALEQLHAHHRAFSSSEDWTTLDDEARELAKSAINLATKQ